MGQVLRTIKYSQTENMSNQRPTSLILNNAHLSFYNIDDGIMGGQSFTHIDQLFKSTTPKDNHESSANKSLFFTGEINTNGGGFASIKSDLENGLPSDAKGLKLKYIGDGKTYKITFSKGQGSGGPFSSSPNWQFDLPTTSGENAAVEEKTIYFNEFVPSFGGRKTLSKEEMSTYHFDNEEMKQIGIMLSLKLSNGNANPVETFGSGIFNFRLELEDMELV
mmetsp:Transcript_24014/g.27405  ORF Transcript_24014/g.27405 Transcript_24014/m.27405 type:complete len:221 (+) Transcript_24014:54-716(+)